MFKRCLLRFHWSVSIVVTGVLLDGQEFAIIEKDCAHQSVNVSDLYVYTQLLVVRDRPLVAEVKNRLALSSFNIFL